MIQPRLSLTRRFAPDWVAALSSLAATSQHLSPGAHQQHGSRWHVPRRPWGASSSQALSRRASHESARAAATGFTGPHGPLSSAAVRAIGSSPAARASASAFMDWYNAPVQAPRDSGVHSAGASPPVHRQSNAFRELFPTSPPAADVARIPSASAVLTHTSQPHQAVLRCPAPQLHLSPPSDTGSPVVAGHVAQSLAGKATAAAAAAAVAVRAQQQGSGPLSRGPTLDGILEHDQADVGRALCAAVRIAYASNITATSNKTTSSGGCESPGLDSIGQFAGSASGHHSWLFRKWRRRKALRAPDAARSALTMPPASGWRPPRSPMARSLPSAHGAAALGAHGGVRPNALSCPLDSPAGGSPSGGMSDGAEGKGQEGSGQQHHGRLTDSGRRSSLGEMLGSARRVLAHLALHGRGGARGEPRKSRSSQEAEACGGERSASTRQGPAHSAGQEQALSAEAQGGSAGPSRLRGADGWPATAVLAGPPGHQGKQREQQPSAVNPQAQTAGAVRQLGTALGSAAHVPGQGSFSGHQAAPLWTATAAAAAVDGGASVPGPSAAPVWVARAAGPAPAAGAHMPIAAPVVPHGRAGSAAAPVGGRGVWLRQERSEGSVLQSPFGVAAAAEAFALALGSSFTTGSPARPPARQASSSHSREPAQLPPPCHDHPSDPHTQPTGEKVKVVRISTDALNAGSGTGTGSPRGGSHGTQHRTLSRSSSSAKRGCVITLGSSGLPDPSASSCGAGGARRTLLPPFGSPLVVTGDPAAAHQVALLPSPGGGQSSHRRRMRCVMSVGKQSSEGATTGTTTGSCPDDANRRPPLLAVGSWAHSGSCGVDTLDPLIHTPSEHPSMAMLSTLGTRGSRTRAPSTDGTTECVLTFAAGLGSTMWAHGSRAEGQAMQPMEDVAECGGF